MAYIQMGCYLTLQNMEATDCQRFIGKNKDTSMHTT